jgi:hypothetical protein
LQFLFILIQEFIFVVNGELPCKDIGRGWGVLVLISLEPYFLE